MPGSDHRQMQRTLWVHAQSLDSYNIKANIKTNKSSTEWIVWHFLLSDNVVSIHSFFTFLCLPAPWTLCHPAKLITPSALLQEYVALLGSGIACVAVISTSAKLSGCEIRMFSPWFFLCSCNIVHDVLHAFVNNSSNSINTCVYNQLLWHFINITTSQQMGPFLLWCRYCRNHGQE